MTHTPHQLAEEFPEHAEKLHELKEKNPDFARLADEYEALNSSIVRYEERVEVTDEIHEEELRKKRVFLKDKIAEILASA